MPIYDHVDTDWVRIGRYDRARRRSTWARLEFIEGPPPYWGFLDHEVTAVELCSGREGDDAFCRVERGDPAFHDLLNVIGYSIGNIDDSDEPTETGSVGT